MPSNEGLIVPRHPKPVVVSPDLNNVCRRSSLQHDSTGGKQIVRNSNRHLVIPLMSSTNNNQKYDSKNGRGVGSGHNYSEGHNKIDPVAIALAAQAKRQQEQVQLLSSSSLPPTTSSSSSSSSSSSLPNNFNPNRRGSLDANVEYAVAMVNIVDPQYDMDTRELCPFGTRRDSVCGGGGTGTGRNHNNNNDSNGHSGNSSNQQTKDSSKRPRRRILKKVAASSHMENNPTPLPTAQDTDHPHNMIVAYNSDANNNGILLHNNNDGISAITTVPTIPISTARPMRKIATISQTNDYHLVRTFHNNNQSQSNNNDDHNDDECNNRSSSIDPLFC